MPPTELSPNRDHFVAEPLLVYRHLRYAARTTLLFIPMAPRVGRLCRLAFPGVQLYTRHDSALLYHEVLISDAYSASRPPGPATAPDTTAESESTGV